MDFRITLSPPLAWMRKRLELLGHAWTDEQITLSALPAIQEAFRRTWAAKGSNAGSPWPPVTAAYSRRKTASGHGSVHGVYTGRLRSQLLNPRVLKNTKGKMRVGFNDLSQKWGRSLAKKKGYTFASWDLSTEAMAIDLVEREYNLQWEKAAAAFNTYSLGKTQ